MRSATIVRSNDSRSVAVVTITLGSLMPGKATLKIGVVSDLQAVFTSFESVLEISASLPNVVRSNLHQILHVMRQSDLRSRLDRTHFVHFTEAKQGNQC